MMVMIALLLACGDASVGGDSGSAGECADNIHDADGDGYRAQVDCDDTDPDVGGPEWVWHDYDGDGYGGDAEAVQLCPDMYEDTLVFVGGDCDDTDALIHPGAAEICDGFDNDCDGLTDDDDVSEPVDGVPWYPDTDGDGYGDPWGTPERWCSYVPEDLVDNARDCDAFNADRNPAADDDTCNGVDDDCDGEIDEGADTSRWYLDADGDGIGRRDVSLSWCGAPDIVDQPGVWVATGGDCDDEDASRGGGC